MSDLRWFFVDMNSYFARCEQQLNPRLRGRPVGVLPMMGVATTCCLAASPEAKTHGVKTGTSVADARRLCPGITFLPARPKAYVEFHHKIVEAVESILPVEDVLSIDEMACRLMGSQQQPERATALAHGVKAAIRAKAGDYLSCSVGIAPNRLLAKMGSDMQKPDGLVLIPRSQIRDKLLTLVPRDIPGIGPRMEQRLALKGVRSMEQLLRCNIHQMRVLWGGVVGERFYHWLRGDDVYVAPTRTTSMGHQHVLEPVLRTSEGASIVAMKLLTKAAARLRREGYYARRLTVHVRFMEERNGQGGGPSSWEGALKIPETQDTMTLLKNLVVLWSGVPQGRPLRVGVVFSDLIPADQHQFSLFEDPKREMLSRALDGINDRFGGGTLRFAGQEAAEDSAPTRIPFTRVPGLREFEGESV